MKSQTEAISGDIFLIGIALLWITGWWFPGIFFVIGAASMARALREDSHWTNANGALWMFGLGFIFWLNLPWAVILLIIGLSMLFSCNSGYKNMFSEKAKNDHKPKNDDYDII